MIYIDQLKCITESLKGDDDCRSRVACLQSLTSGLSSLELSLIFSCVFCVDYVDVVFDHEHCKQI